MERATSFAELLDAADGLSLDDQEILSEILHRRVIERRRKELSHEVCESRQEYEHGGCRPATPDELMNEILR